ncbi:MAG: type III pantothenate kinase, partial [OM182 bacterium]|nr:type III pantothenate kinase [OM182 bacterium]
MDIEIDAGNTRLKWRLRDESGVSATSVASSPREIAETIDRRAVSGGVADPHTPIGRVRIASVRSPDALAEFVAECRDLFSLDPQVARVVQG